MCSSAEPEKLRALADYVTDFLRQPDEQAYIVASDIIDNLPIRLCMTGAELMTWVEKVNIYCVNKKVTPNKKEITMQQHPNFPARRSLIATILAADFENSIQCYECLFDAATSSMESFDAFKAHLRIHGRQDVMADRLLKSLEEIHAHPGDYSDTSILTRALLARIRTVAAEDKTGSRWLEMFLKIHEGYLGVSQQMKNEAQMKTENDVQLIHLIDAVVTINHPTGTYPTQGLNRAISLIVDLPPSAFELVELAIRALSAGCMDGAFIQHYKDNLRRVMANTVNPLYRMDAIARIAAYFLQPGQHQGLPQVEGIVVNQLMEKVWTALRLSTKEEQLWPRPNKRPTQRMLGESVDVPGQLGGLLGGHQALMQYRELVPVDHGTYPYIVPSPELADALLQVFEKEPGRALSAYVSTMAAKKQASLADEQLVGMYRFLYNALPAGRTAAIPPLAGETKEQKVEEAVFWTLLLSSSNSLATHPRLNSEQIAAVFTLIASEEKRRILIRIV